MLLWDVAAEPWVQTGLGSGPWASCWACSRGRAGGAEGSAGLVVRQGAWCFRPRQLWAPQAVLATAGLQFPGEACRGPHARPGPWSLSFREIRVKGALHGTQAGWCSVVS